jgi:hypothetical protein
MLQFVHEEHGQRLAGRPRGGHRAERVARRRTSLAAVRFGDEGRHRAQRPQAR